jgi:thiol:disulfide interchange protein DsbD
VRAAPLLLLAALAQAADPLRVELAGDAPEVAPGGTIRVGVRFRLDPQWHVYWKNPGDSGAAPSVKWTLPPGVAASALGWPAPVRIPTPPFMTFGYEGEVVLSSQITVPRSYTAPTLPVAAAVEWLACDANGCIPGEAELSLEIPVKPGASPPREDFTRGFPRAGRAFSATAREGEILLRADGPLAGATFFPEDPEVLDHAAEQRAGPLGLGLRVAKEREEPVPRLVGVLVRGEEAWLVDVPVTAAEDGGSSPLAWGAAVLALGAGLALFLRLRRARGA